MPERWAHLNKGQVIVNSFTGSWFFDVLGIDFMRNFMNCMEKITSHYLLIMCTNRWIPLSFLIMKAEIPHIPKEKYILQIWYSRAILLVGLSLSYTI